MSNAPETVPEIEITPAMLAAGIEAANLISYEWGYGEEANLVSRVYLAMVAAKVHSVERAKG